MVEKWVMIDVNEREMFGIDLAMGGQQMGMTVLAALVSIDFNWVCTKTGNKQTNRQTIRVKCTRSNKSG